MLSKSLASANTTVVTHALNLRLDAYANMLIGSGDAM